MSNSERWHVWAGGLQEPPNAAASELSQLDGCWSLLCLTQSTQRWCSEHSDGIVHSRVIAWRTHLRGVSVHPALPASSTQLNKLMPWPCVLQGGHPADGPGQHEHHGPCWLVSHTLAAATGARQQLWLSWSCCRAWAVAGPVDPTWPPQSRNCAAAGDGQDQCMMQPACKQDMSQGTTACMDIPLPQQAAAAAAVSILRLQDQCGSLL